MPDQGAAKNRLVSIGSSPQREYSLDKLTVAIGSHPSNDLVIDDTTVSRRHATTTRKADGFELADLGSTNGTFVNGRQVRKPVTVKSGDEIKFGSARFAFNPASVAKRLRSGLLILAVMFVAGFAVARYRSKTMPANPELVARTSSSEAN